AVHGEKHPDVAKSLNNIGISYSDLGNVAKGLEYQKQALRITMKVYGENHLDVATSLNNIGTSYSALGDVAKALEYQKQALKIWAVYSENHQDVATILTNIAFMYYSLSQYLLAKNYYVQALMILKATYKEDHPDIENVSKGLATVEDLLASQEAET